jgi:hypothetical protein
MTNGERTVTVSIPVPSMLNDFESLTQAADLRYFWTWAHITVGLREPSYPGLSPRVIGSGCR